MTAIDRQHQMQTFSARRLHETLQSEFLQEFPDLARTADDGGPGEVFGRIEIEDESIRLLELVGARPPGMNLERANLSQRDQAGHVINHDIRLRFFLFTNRNLPQGLRRADTG